jgi:two-component system sensor histidine kinase DegS
MNTTRNGLSANYLASLRAHLKQRPAGSSARAERLGRRAVASGTAIVDLAGIHQQAVLALAATHDFTGLIERAGFFFSQALVPLEADRHATRETNRQLLKGNETLRQHTAALARGNRKLEREVGRHRSAEAKTQQAKERYRRLFLGSQLMQTKLHRLTRQMLLAQEEERKHISRELHDEVVQTLVGISVKLSALGRSAGPEAPTLRQKIAQTQRLVENSVRAVHRFALELRPTVLDDLGLIAALHAFSQRLAARKKIRIKITAFGGVEALSIAKRTVLFRVAQEALNNVARHAEASLIMLGISEHEGAIQMEISDNGKSFHVGATLLAKNNRQLGLVGMRERMEMIGGTLTIISAPGRGTTILAKMPFKPLLKLK